MPLTDQLVLLKEEWFHGVGVIRAGTREDGGLRLVEDINVVKGPCCHQNDSIRVCDNHVVDGFDADFHEMEGFDIETNKTGKGMDDTKLYANGVLTTGGKTWPTNVKRGYRKSHLESSKDTRCLMNVRQ